MVFPAFFLKNKERKDRARISPKRKFWTCFYASFFLFVPFAGHPSSSPFFCFSAPFHPFLQGKKKHININKFAGLSRDWVGAQNLFMWRRFIRGPWPYVPEGFLEEILVMVIVFSFPRTNFQRTMTICARRFSWGNLGHGHRLFLSHYVFFRVIPYGGEKTHKQNPGTIPWKFCLRVFFFMCFFFVFSLPISLPRKMLYSVERGAQHRAWRGAVSGWASLHKVREGNSSLKSEWKEVSLREQLCPSDQSALIDASLWRKPVKTCAQILKHTKKATEQTAMRTKWFKHIAI